MPCSNKTKIIKTKNGTYRRLSVCCNADVDYRGGGYEDEYIHPIEDFCKKCGQTLEVNGSEIKNEAKAKRSQ